MSAVTVPQKGKQYAALGLRVIKANGQVIDFGKVSNRPIIGFFQKALMNYRIKKYQRSQQNGS